MARMTFFNTSASVQQKIAIIVPVIALALSVFVVWPKYQAYRAEMPVVEKMQSDLDALKSAAPPPENLTIAAVDPLPTEPPEFMSQIQAIASSAHCRVCGFDLKAPTAPAAGAASQPADQAPISAVHAEITLVARYIDIRNFVAMLAHAPRMFVITDLDVADSSKVPKEVAFPGALLATVDIERFVTAPTAK